MNIKLNEKMLVVCSVVIMLIIAVANILVGDIAWAAWFLAVAAFQMHFV